MAGQQSAISEGGPKLDAHQIILRPILSEKGTHQSTRHNAYPFRVNPLATKDDIRDAIEELFDVRVIAVRTQNRPGKRRRYRGRFGRLSSWKKAIVTLHEEHKLEFF